MNIKHGAFCFASSKMSRTFFSDSPDMPDTIVGADIEMKGNPSSPANAFARRVFPHPGGPYSNTPLKVSHTMSEDLPWGLNPGM